LVSDIVAGVGNGRGLILSRRPRCGNQQQIICDSRTAHGRIPFEQLRVIGRFRQQHVVGGNSVNQQVQAVVYGRRDGRGGERRRARRALKGVGLKRRDSVDVGECPEAARARERVAKVPYERRAGCVAGLRNPVSERHLKVVAADVVPEFGPSRGHGDRRSARVGAVEALDCNRGQQELAGRYLRGKGKRQRGFSV
jgi:hypothetical protein